MVRWILASSALMACAPGTTSPPPVEAPLDASPRDLAAFPDVPVAPDVPVVPDVPVARDVPALMDVLAPRDVPAVPDVPTSRALRADARWHIDLEAPVNTAVDADWFDIDLFDNDAAVVRALHARGRGVVCYFSAGSAEDWRPDYQDIPAAARGAALDGWPGERWLDVRHAGVLAVMRARMDRARAMGCDGVDPDNVDGYTNATGFPLRAADQLTYNRALAAEAHARGLRIGLKNDLDQVSALAPSFDFAINEQCFAFGECAALAPFTAAEKPVLQIEYGDVTTLARTVCPRAAALRLFSILPGADRLTGAYRRCVDGADVR
jgi:hypothetical protein